jgi:hypothetical protein
MHPVTESIWLYNEQGSADQRRRKVARLAEALDGDPTMNALRVIEILTIPAR